jgi:hypothetical protein
MTLRTCEFIRAALIVAPLSTCACTLADASLEGSARDPTRLPLSDARPLADLAISVTAPRSVPYDAQSVGASASFLSIHVSSRRERPVALPRLYARFTASREGVSFPCGLAVSDDDRREPTVLAPGQSWTVERPIRCEMPLPGIYHVGIWIGVGAGPSGAAPRGSERFEGVQSIEVEAREGQSPQALPAGAGAYALLTGPSVVVPMRSEAWARGDYRVLVALINGNAHPVPIGNVQLETSVFKRGSPLPCNGGRQPVDVPAVLGPGSTYLARLPLTCAPSSEGQYEVVGRLVLADRSSVEIGRVGLLVTTIPYVLFTPSWPLPDRRVPPPWP